MIIDLLTKALIFKPKKLKDGWEHKNGYYVSHSTNTAMNIVDSKRKTFDFNQENHYRWLSRDILRQRANSLIYKIESSSNNYFDFIWWFSVLIVGLSILKLMWIVWQNPRIDEVRIMIIFMIYLPIITFLYWEKMKLEKARIREFLLIESLLINIEKQENI